MSEVLSWIRCALLPDLLQCNHNHASNCQLGYCTLSSSCSNPSGDNMAAMVHGCLQLRMVCKVHSMHVCHSFHWP